MATTRVHPVMVELHRFGAADSQRVPGSYILTTGFEQEAREVKFDLSAEAFYTTLRDLRYRYRSKSQAERAIGVLSDQAARVIKDIATVPDSLLQIDFVAGANELWTFPFEAFCEEGVPLFANRERRVVFTRRIRGAFSDHRFAWPIKPSVLFAHAAIDEDLEPALVKRHRKALEAALEPWTGGKAIGAEMLVVIEVASAKVLADVIARRRANPELPDFTHVHLLAHGKSYKDERTDGPGWGTRLGKASSPAVRPKALGDLLAPVNGLPVVVTVASCDSGNELNSALGNYSLAQELHRRGVPVVIGSQFPLTKNGSEVLTKHFYTPLMRGADVRIALHEARVALYEKKARHDWLSVVGYVRLPEGYADRLIEIRLQTELALLKALQDEIDALILKSDDEGVARVEQRVLERVESLKEVLGALRPEDIALRQEAEGLLASTHKRSAEMYFHCNRPEQVRPELQAALDHYRRGFKLDIHNHWLGAQQLALEAVLDGRFEDVSHWSAALLGARFEVETNSKAFWPYGTIAEIQFLRHLAGHEPDPKAVSEALLLLRERAGKASFPIESTWRQFKRYVDWWTCDHGFVPGCDGLRETAKAIVEQLKPIAEMGMGRSTA